MYLPYDASCQSIGRWVGQFVIISLKAGKWHTSMHPFSDTNLFPFFRSSVSVLYLIIDNVYQSDTAWFIVFIIL